MSASNWIQFFKNYQVESGMSIVKRIAHLLDWAANKDSEAIIPYNIICRFIMGFDFTPKMNNQKVDEIRSSLSRARPVLQEKYKRDLKNVSGVGARATNRSHGGIDVVKSTTGNAVKRVNSATAALTRNAKLIDPEKLPTQGPDKVYTDWYKKQVSPAIRMLTSDDRILKLLPPVVAPVKETANTATKEK
jgi:hypothetical protein